MQTGGNGTITFYDDVVGLEHALRNIHRGHRVLFCPATNVFQAHFFVTTKKDHTPHNKSTQKVSPAAIEWEMRIAPHTKDITGGVGAL